MTLFEEIKSLKERLRQLEVEQERQDKALDESIKDFQEILRLEAELLGIDEKELQKAVGEILFIRDTEEETEQLEQKLDKVTNDIIEKAEKKAAQEYGTEETDRLEAELTGLDKSPQPPAAKAAQDFYYVICLSYEAQTPSEWSDESGGGWRERGKGKQYNDIKQAKRRLLQLKKKWPDYPLKIIKRQITAE